MFKLLNWSFVYHLPQLLRLQYCTDQAAELIICLSPPSAAQAAILHWSSCSIDHLSIVPLSCSGCNTVLFKLLNRSFAYRSPQLLRLQYCTDQAAQFDHISITPLSCSGCNTLLCKLLNWSYVSSFFIPLTLQKHNTEASKQIFPEKELRGISPNFHIYVSVRDLYIPTIGLPILLQENMWIFVAVQLLRV